MGRIVVNSLTLDGVMQALGRPDEDRRGGFEHGGWAQPYFDEVMGSMAAEGIAKGGAFVLGRRTYEDFALLARPAGGQPVHLGAQRTPEVRPLVLGSGRRLSPKAGHRSPCNSSTRGRRPPAW